MAAKRKTSAKQRAAARRNIKKARAALRRKKTPRKRPKKRAAPSKTKRRSPRKTNKPKRSTKNVVGRGKKIPFLDNPTVRKAAIGLGLGTIATVVLGLVSPQLAANPLIRTGVGFLGGGPIGAVATLLIGGGGLGGLFGGQGQGAGAGAGAA